MTQFALDALEMGEKRPYTIFDAHNATWTISARMAENMPWFLRPVVKLETARIQNTKPCWWSSWIIRWW
jgi:hypothetical protein